MLIQGDRHHSVVARKRGQLGDCRDAKRIQDLLVGVIADLPVNLQFVNVIIDRRFVGFVKIRLETVSYRCDNIG